MQVLCIYCKYVKYMNFYMRVGEYFPITGAHYVLNAACERNTELTKSPDLNIHNKHPFNIFFC